MREIWPQLVILVLLVAGFLFLIVRLRPGRGGYFPMGGSLTSRQIIVRLERSPWMVILLALIAILILLVLVHGAYKLAGGAGSPRGAVPPTADVQSLMAQLASQLEAYYREHGAYPTRLDLLEKLGEDRVLPAMDPYREPPAPLDYRTDGVSWWLLRSYGPDGRDGAGDTVFPLDDFRGERLDHPRIRDLVYDPSNGARSAGDIIQVGGEARPAATR